MQPNNLIKSRYDFTSVENKLFHKILYNAQKQSNNKPIYHAVIKKEEFREFIKRRNDYIDKNGHLKTFGSGLINTYDFNHDTSEYEITMHEILYNHITDFISMQGKGYTALNMSLLFTFKGAYTQRLYTLMRLWSRQNTDVEVRYKLDEIRSYLKMKPEFYPEYKHFKQNVIKRALKEINEKGNMKVDIKQEIRKGRKVDEIVFSVIDYEPRQYFKKDTKREECISNTTYMVHTNDMYIPDETIFNKGTLRQFKLDFKNIDFRNEYMSRAFADAIMITLDRDDVETIKYNSYKFFKGTLDNKIIEYKSNEQRDIEHKNEMDKYW